MGDSAYSFSLTTFSRTGKLLQIEYALNAVANGKTCLGICAKDGVVIATERKLASPLVDIEHVHKVEKITPNIGFCYSGVGPDYRVLVKKARKTSQAYLRTYGESQPVSQMVKQTASVMQEYTQRGGVRPFGVSLLVGGVDSHVDNKPHLYQVDPSGAYFSWKATAIGRNHINAKNFLEKRYSEDMELEDAIHTALLTLREGFEGEMDCYNIQVGVASCNEDAANGKFRTLTPEQIQDYLDEAN